MKLIGSLTSPFVRKVRIVLAEKKLDYKFHLEDVWSSDTKISAANPLGKVPCLMMEEGEAIFDSRVIVEYLDTLTPVGKLIPVTGRSRAEVKCWEALADGLVEAAVLIRLEDTQRTPEQRSANWVKRQEGKISASIQVISQGIGDRQWFHGSSFTLADISVGCALGFLDFRFPQLEWRNQHAELARWFDKLQQRPSLVETAPRLS